LGIGSRCSGCCDAAKLNFANPDEANEVHAGYAVKDSLKNGPASQRKPKERFKRCRDARAVLQQACAVELGLPQAMQRHVYSQRQCTGPWAQPPAPPDIKVDLLPHSAEQLLTRKDSKAARLAFVRGNVDSW